MRLEEFANAQDQLDLWKLVSDAVWAGINTQGQQQQQVQAQVATVKSPAQDQSQAVHGQTDDRLCRHTFWQSNPTLPPNSIILQPRHAMTCVPFEKTASISTCSIGSVGCLG